MTMLLVHRMIFITQENKLMAIKFSSTRKWYNMCKR